MREEGKQAAAVALRKRSTPGTKPRRRLCHFVRPHGPQGFPFFACLESHETPPLYGYHACQGFHLWIATGFQKTRLRLGSTLSPLKLSLFMCPARSTTELLGGFGGQRYALPFCSPLSCIPPKSNRICRKNTAIDSG